MGKDKLRRFSENLTFKCFVQPEFDDIFRCDHPLKGHWQRDFSTTTIPSSSNWAAARVNTPWR